MANASTVPERIVVLEFADVLTFTDGNDILLSNDANFVTAAGSILSLQCDADGDWHELFRNPISSAFLLNTGDTGSGTYTLENVTVTDDLVGDGDDGGSGSGSSVATSINEIPNAGVEEWITSTEPYFWNCTQSWQWSHNDSYGVQETTILRTQPYSVKLDSDRSLSMGDKIRVEAGESYVLSYWIYATVAQGQVCNIFPYDTSEVLLTAGDPLGNSVFSYSAPETGWQDVFNPGATTWYHQYYTFDFSDDVKYIRIRIGGAYTAGSFVYIDNIQFTRGTLRPEFHYKPIFDSLDQQIYSSLSHGSVTDNMTTATDGFITLSGTARATIDIKFPVTRLKKGGISDPAEAVKGITYVLSFDKAADEEVFATEEIPHA